MKLIQSEHWRLWIDPQIGAQWLAAEVCRAGQWHAVVPDCREGSSRPRAGQDESAPLAAANFHMIPYSNRIRDARFVHDGNVVQLENADNHAIHGALRKLPWKTMHCDTGSLLCQIDTRDHASVNWPWPMRASIEQSISANTLSSHISITNDGDTSMPVGTGWHPYFVRQIAGSQPTLTLPVTGVFPDANGDCLPDGAAVALTDELNFRQTTALDPDQRIDCCLSGLYGECRIAWQEAGITLKLRASDNCRYLILFNPDKPHFALEPVTNANDAFNLHAQGIASGTQELAAGDTLKASMHIAVS